MGNKQAKRTNSMIDQENTRLRGEDTRFQNTYLPERSQERDWAQGARGDIYGGYKRLTDDAVSGGGLFGGGGGGGYTPQTYTPEKIGLSGYWGESANIARTLGQGGEWDPRIRKGYQDFADTGGYSADDISNIRSRATSVIPSFYESLRNRMSQRANAAGANVGSIYSAASDRMARQQAQGAQQAALEAETGISDRVREGKLQGLSGLYGLDNSMNQFRGTGMSGLANVAAGEQDVLSQNAMIENQARMFNANEANSAAASGAAAGRAAQDDRLRAYMSGLGGMMDVYTSNPAELARYDNLLMGNRELTGNQIGGNLGLRASYNPNRDWFDRAMQGVGAVSGLAGAFMTGGA